MKLRAFKFWEAKPQGSWGPSAFPWDMLRYDPCFYNPKFPGVLLFIWYPGYLKKAMEPTHDRWRSFSWQLVLVTDNNKGLILYESIQTEPDQWWTISQSMWTKKTEGYSLKDFFDKKPSENYPTRELPFDIEKEMVPDRRRKA